MVSWVYVAFGGCFVMGFVAFGVWFYVAKQNKPKVITLEQIPLDYTAEGLREETESKCNKPLDRLTIGVDIPRLIKKMMVIDVDTDAILFQGSFFATQEGEQNGKPYMRKDNMVKEFLLTLAEELEPADSNLPSLIDSKFSEYLHDTGDMGEQLATFIKDNIPEESTVCRILKTCTQSVIAPAVLRLKTKVGVKVPYRDVRQGWKICIKLYDDAIHVIHKRKEQNWTGSTDEFQFTWRLKIVFNRTATKLRKTNVEITDTVFGNDVAEDRKQEIIAVLSQFMQQNKKET